MFMYKRIVALCILASAAPPALAEGKPRLGQPMSAEEIAAVDFVILPDGDGLPPGAGTAQDGAVLYQVRCIACHGERGQGGTNDALAGGAGTIAGPAPVKTVGSYWPYATTLFDYIRRAMPYQDPGSLTNDEVYALTAYLLYVNGIVEETTSIDARSLPQVRMPNRDNFVRAKE